MPPIAWVCRGGLTLPDNLCVTCSSCHKNLHEGRLFVARTREGGLVWTDRQGHRLGESPPRPLEERTRRALAWMRRATAA